MATMNSDSSPDDSQPAPATNNGSKPGAAAFPQTQVAFPTSSARPASSTGGWSAKKLMDEISGPKPAY
jgi:hypothetical protein